MCVIIREILPQVAVCIIDRLIHINIKIGYIVCQRLDPLISTIDSGIVENRIGGVFSSGHMHNGFEIDDGIRLQGMDSFNRSLIMFDEIIVISGTHFIDADHQVDFTELPLLQCLINRNLPVIRFDNLLGQKIEYGKRLLAVEGRMSV